MGTGVLRLLGGEVENRYVRRGPTSYSVIGEAMFRPQSASEHAIPTSRQNLIQINSVFIAKPDVSCCACAHHFPPKIFQRQVYYKASSDCCDGRAEAGSKVDLQALLSRYQRQVSQG